MGFETKLKILRFLIIFTFFQILVYYINHNFDLVFLKDLTIKFISIFGFETNKDVIYIPQISSKLKIVNMCTGILMYFTLISLFFAFFKFKRAIIYSILMIPIVFILNLIRIISSIYVGIITKNFELLKFTHDFIWFFLTPIIIYLIFKEIKKFDEKLDKKNGKN